MDNNEQSPRTTGGPADKHNTNFKPTSGGLVSASSVVENVLDRLASVRRSPRGWIARCPAHEDRHQSLSVGEGRDGRALVNCFAGCEAADIVRAVQLELRDLFRPRDDNLPLPRRPRAKAKPYPVPRSIAQTLVETSEFALMFEAAKMLAPLPPGLVKQDIVSAWDGLIELGIDVPALVKLAALLRGIAFFRYCTSERCEDSDIARAVDHLVAEIERRAEA